MLRRLALAVAVPFLLIVSGCAMRMSTVAGPDVPPAPGTPPPPSGWTSALANAVGMPAEDSYDAKLFEWTDNARARPVLAKLYQPKVAKSVPLVVVSHGIGGSREGYSYIGKYLAANGIASLHLQHAGSDRALWFGNPITMLFRLQGAAAPSEAIDRARDVRFALDTVLGDASLAGMIDATRIAMTGHSYGANTALLVSGAQVEQGDQVLQFTDARIKAAVIISAPRFYSQGDPGAILGGVNIPTLHITSTGDDITIPGFRSGVEDRVAVYEAISARTQAKKILAVFKEGSHSMFTDRLNTGGVELNPKVKRATRELVLAFFQDHFANARDDSKAFGAWALKHTELIAQTKAR
jgi:dienelactone hydrolase